MAILQGEKSLLAPQPILLSEETAYFGGVVFTHLNNNFQELALPDFTYAITGEEFIYPIQQGDTLDSIARQQYKDKVDNPQRYWWVIARANQVENAVISPDSETQLPIDNLLHIGAMIGKRIIIPDINRFKALFQ